MSTWTALANWSINRAITWWKNPVSKCPRFKWRMSQALPKTISVIEISANRKETVMTQPSTRILVLGAGMAGLLFTLRLSGKVASESVQITLVDEADTFTVRPRLHEFATN